jgi:methionyl aminopeptidase
MFADFADARRRKKMTKEALVREVNRGLESIMNGLARNVRRGADVADLELRFFRQCYDSQLYPSMLGMDGFPRSCSISVNDEVCHCLPYPRTLKDGDIVTLDGCTFNGLHSDRADTYCIGKVSGEHKRLVDTARDAMWAGIAVCKPGVPYNRIGEAVSKVVHENGFVLIERFTGHGIGKELHMEPSVYNCANGVTRKMKVGDMLAVEPLVTIGCGKVRAHPDGFGYSTRNGKYAAHFERTIRVTEDGYEVLNG